MMTKMSTFLIITEEKFKGKLTVQFHISVKWAPFRHNLTDIHSNTIFTQYTRQPVALKSCDSKNIVPVSLRGLHTVACNNRRLTK